MQRRRRRRPVYLDMHLPRSSGGGALLLTLMLLGALAAFVTQSVLYLRQLSAEIAMSDATDQIILSINGAISRFMADRDYEYDYFVALVRDEEGEVTAVTTNMSRVNALSAELLEDVVLASDSGGLNMEIPLGDLLGASLLLGRGPMVPIKVSMLTSSRVDMKNELSDAGINQTKHQIKLDVIVDVDVVLPWKTMTTQVSSEILVAETIIVGSVPQTYFSVG